jgi:hypothetical protein
MIFACGPGEISCARSGWVTSVTHSREPGLGYLAGAALGRLRVDGQQLDAPVPQVLADADEVEFVYTYPERFRVVVRHTFAAGWGLRLSFTSLAARTQQLERAELRLEPQPGCVAWALTLGVTGAYAVTPASGTGPVLGGVLRVGSLDRATESGLELTPFELRPEARYVVQLHWDWYGSPRDFTLERSSAAPSALFVTTGEPVQVRVDEDVAVVAPSGVSTTEELDHLEVVSEVSGSYPFELRSARGTTTFHLQWVDPVEELLGAWVPEALSRPRTAAGVIKLGTVAEALVVQQALVHNQVDDPDDAAEALDLFTARLGDGAPLTPMDAAYLSREYGRLGDLDLLSQAAAALLAQPAPLPGLGMAATQLCLSLIVAGRPVDEMLRHLLRLVGQVGADERGYPGRSVAAQTAELELVAVTHAGPGIGGALPSPREVTPRVAALGLHLGAGLKGRAVTPLPVTQLSHLITVLQLLPEGLGAGLYRLWGCSAQTLARRATPELLARLDRQSLGDAHAWLVLGLQTS